MTMEIATKKAELMTEISDRVNPPVLDNDNDNDASSTTNVSKEDETSAAKTITPLKKPRGAYFIFQAEKRPQVKAELQHEINNEKNDTTKGKVNPITVIAKRIGELWKELDPKEKERYRTQALQEKEAYNEALKARGDNDAENNVKTKALHRRKDEQLTLPLARVRKIARLDPEVKSLSKEAALLLTKTAEEFTIKLAKETYTMAQMQNRRNLLTKDVLDVCELKDSFQFLKDDIQDLVQKLAVERQTEREEKKKIKSAVDDNGKKSGTVGVKPITSFFAPKKKST